MKTRLTLIFLLAFVPALAQSSGEDAINKTIEEFFEGFHNRDTAQMRSVLHEQVHMQRIGTDAGGKPFIKEESVMDFLTSMASLPDTLKIEERLHFYITQTDGSMANAWTPYSFYVQDKLHHCGVNSFQLFYDGAAWKIIYIVDTRQLKACTEPEKAD
ncbi:MAG: nuclear transport factor 2 family protein [Robiginitalea sp.]|uniref:nuclear transport factor 2 family protein n=1 Tax=Robiginitalea sp. TaxID=1902411 RepID=UPI003C725050